MGKTLWRDCLEPDQEHGLASEGKYNGLAYRQSAAAQQQWWTFLQEQPTTDSAVISDIYSEVLAIAPIDFLAVMQAIDSQQSFALPPISSELSLQHFYWENQQRAILSLGSIRHLVLDGEERFERSQQFIESHRTKIHCQNKSFQSLDIPYFCCGYTFFDRETKESPFPAGTVFIPRVQLVRQQQKYYLVVNGSQQQRPQLSIIAHQIKHFLEKIPHSLAPSPGIRGTFCTSSLDLSRRFTHAVNHALKLIDAKKLSKIVLAYALDINATQPFNVVDALENLRDNHPDCYIFSMSNHKGETFIGASPERLLAVQDAELVTDALAGSAPRGASAFEDRNLAQTLLNSEKEHREHQVVADFLIGELRKLGLQPRRSPRTLLQLSNIQHLWTPITAKLPHQLHPLEVVARLHPTPAVAGVPRAIACDYIARSESFSRTLYAAPIGWLDCNGNAEFIVAIRSALIQGKHARLYGGAGIVKGSDPEREYAEVQLKLQSLLNALT